LLPTLILIFIDKSGKIDLRLFFTIPNNLTPVGIPTISAIVDHNAKKKSYIIGLLSRGGGDFERQQF